MYFLWMLLLLYVDFSTENECSTVQRFNQSVVAYQLSLVHEHENKNAFCHTLQIVSMIIKQLNTLPALSKLLT